MALKLHKRVKHYSAATLLLLQNGFNADGTVRSQNQNLQYIFEKRIIKTPMGNRMR